MKKMTAVLLAAVMAFSLAACGGEDTDGTTAAETEESSSTDETEAAAEEPEYFSAFNLDNLSDYVQLGEYKGIEVTAQDTTVTDEDVETELQSQVENATPIYEEITEGTVADGDVVNIDYEGTLDGVAFDGGTDTDFNLTIGSGQFIDGFEDGLIGKNIGDTVELNLTFPEDYTVNSDLAGQAVVFTVTINYVQGAEIPQELNDEFVQRVTDGTYTTVDDYRAYVRSDLETTKAQEAEDTMVNDAWTQIMENATYPNEATDLVNYIHDNEMYNFEASLSMYGMDKDSYLEMMGVTEEELEADLMDYSRNAAQSQLLIRAIVEAEGMDEMSDEEYQSRCETLAEELGLTADTMTGNYPEQMIRDAIYQDMVQEFLLQNIVQVEGESAEETTAAGDTTAAETTAAAE